MFLTDDNRFEFDLNLQYNPSHPLDVPMEENGQQSQDEAYDIDVLSNLVILNVKDFTSAVSKKVSDPKIAFHIETSPFVSIKNQNGENRVIKKSRLMWWLQQGTRQLSNDRALRVTQTSSLTVRISRKQVIGRQTIKLGDWCVFKKERNDDFLLGRVLFLGMLIGNRKDLSKFIFEYEYGTANVSALCSWYTFERKMGLTGVLIEVPGQQHGYICTAPPPNFCPEVNALHYPPAVIFELEQCITNMITNNFTIMSNFQTM